MEILFGPIEIAMLFGLDPAGDPWLPKRKREAFVIRVGGFPLK